MLLNFTTDLYISLVIIFLIIEYVTNKKPWTLNLFILYIFTLLYCGAYQVYIQFFGILTFLVFFIYCKIALQ